MGGGAWWAAVHGVAGSRTRLSDFTITFRFHARKWQPTPVFLPGESPGHQSLVGCRLWGYTESDMTEATWQQHQQQGFPGGSDIRQSACNVGNPGSISGCRRAPGEGNGYPLQYSCLENPRDGGAWWASVYGVTESHTTDVT